MRKYPLGQAFEDGLTHFFGSHGFSSLGKIAGTKAGPDGFLDGLFDGSGRFFESETVAEHESGAENLSAGVGQAFARDVGGGSPGRFVKSERKIHGVFAGSKAGGGEHAERSADHGEFVGQDVSEHVLGNQNAGWLGSRTNCMAALSAYMWESSIESSSSRTRSVTIFLQRTEVSRTLALSTEQILPSLRLAARTAISIIRSISPLGKPWCRWLRVPRCRGSRFAWVGRNRLRR